MKRNSSFGTRYILSAIIAIIFFALAALPTRPQPPAEGTWAFAVMGDPKSNTATFSKLLQLILDDPSRPELLFITGDMVSKGNDPVTWETYKKTISILGDRIRLYPVVGNHDVQGTKDMSTYIKEAQPPGGKAYYSLIYRNAGFICLNSYEPKMAERIGPVQMKWLKETLRDMKPKARIIFAFLHTPLLVRPDYQHNVPLVGAENVKAVLRAGGVTAVFMGHEHRYDHFEEGGVHYFVTAGGGAGLYTKSDDGFHHYCRVTVEPQEVLVQAIGLKGQERKKVAIPLPAARRGN